MEYLCVGHIAEWYANYAYSHYLEGDDDAR
jgi:hypothetical protein